jgi:hypothetical protein
MQGVLSPCVGNASSALAGTAPPPPIPPGPATYSIVDTTGLGNNSASDAGLNVSQAVWCPYSVPAPATGTGTGSASVFINKPGYSAFTYASDW